MKSSSDSDLKLANQLCFALYCASRKMVQSYQPHLQKMGITYPQYLVLMALWEDDNLTVKALGERLLLDSGTLTPLLKRMASAGLLRREHDEDDERQRRIQLTESGKALKKEALMMRTALKCQYAKQLAAGEELREKLQALIAEM